MTSKLQVTLPKVLAVKYGIKPGDELEWLAAGESIRVVPVAAVPNAESALARRLELFDRATRRQQARQGARTRKSSSRHRGWTREELYERGSRSR